MPLLVNSTNGTTILILTCFSKNKYNSEKVFHEYSPTNWKKIIWSKILLWENSIVRAVLWQGFGIQSLNRLAVNLFHGLIKSKSLQERLSYYVEFNFLKHIDLMEFVNEFWKGSWELWQKVPDLFLIQGCCFHSNFHFQVWKEYMVVVFIWFCKAE